MGKHQRQHRRLLLLLLLPSAIALIMSSTLPAVAAKSFIESCKSASQCSSLVAYRSPSEQSLTAIATLFNIDTVSLLAANNLDLRSSLAAAAAAPLLIAAHRVVKVPVSCSCVDGIWRGNATVYKSKPGDTLTSIADSLFGKLVTAKQIAQANGIGGGGGGAALVAGTMLVIPFSCGCSGAFGGGNLVLSYVVQPGDTVDEVVSEYGSVFSDFMAFNSMSNGSELVAGDVVAVPIRACGSSFRRSAFDFGLIVANGSYIITAGHCVQCSCLPNLQQVYCTPAPGIISGSCPDMRCIGTNLTVGEMTTATSAQGCNVTSCLYTGFKKKIVLSSLQSVNMNSCPAPPPPPSYKSAAGTILPPAAAPSSVPAGVSTPGSIPSNSAFAPGPSTAAAAAKFSRIRLEFSSLPLLILLL